MCSTDSFFANLPIRQINGCRYFGPRDEVKGFNPPKGSEIFVARIPQDFPHKELLRIFVNAGQVYDVRLMLTFMKENKGFAFVRYFSPEMASKAIKQINGFRLAYFGRQGHLVAMLSTDHRTLMLTGCAPDVTKEEVECVFRNIDEAELVSVSEEFHKGQASPEFYLLFASHRGAALMKKMNWKDLIPKEWGVLVHLNWQPNNEVNQRRRFKLEKKNYLSFLASGAATNLNGFQNSPVNLGFPRNVLSSLNAEVQPSSQPLEKALVSNAGLSALNTFAPVFKDNNKEQMSQECFLPSPGHFLQPKRSLDAAQGISDYSPLNPLSENIRHQWSLESSPQSRASSCFEPEGAWGGTPLLALPKHDLTGNVKSQWGCGGSQSAHRNFLFEPEDTLGISSPLIQDGVDSLTEDNDKEQMSQECFLPSPGHFLQPKRSLDAAQGISDYSPLNPLSENIRHQWSLESSLQSRASSCFEPEGAWGGTPLLALPKHDLTGNVKSQWGCGDSQSAHRNFLFEPEDTLGISSPLIQDGVDSLTDEKSQPQSPDPPLYSLFGRPIRGRGTNDQAPKSMRF